MSARTHGVESSVWSLVELEFRVEKSEFDPDAGLGGLLGDRLWYNLGEWVLLQREAFDVVQDHLPGYTEPI